MFALLCQKEFGDPASLIKAMHESETERRGEERLPPVTSSWEGREERRREPECDNNNNKKNEISLPPSFFPSLPVIFPSFFLYLFSRRGNAEWTKLVGEQTNSTSSLLCIGGLETPKQYYLIHMLLLLMFCPRYRRRSLSYFLSIFLSVSSFFPC